MDRCTEGNAKTPKDEDVVRREGLRDWRKTGETKFR